MRENPRDRAATNAFFAGGCAATEALELLFFSMCVCVCDCSRTGLTTANIPRLEQALGSAKKTRRMSAPSAPAPPSVTSETSSLASMSASSSASSAAAAVPIDSSSGSGVSVPMMGAAAALSLPPSAPTLECRSATGVQSRAPDGPAPEALPSALSAESKRPMRVATDFDGTHTLDTKRTSLEPPLPLGAKVIACISGRTSAEYGDDIKRLAAVMPVYIRGSGRSGDREHAGRFKAMILAEGGYTHFLEDDPVQAAVIRARCPDLVVCMVVPI